MVNLPNIVAVSLPHVSDSGSETGAASRAHMRPGAVSLTALSALISANGPHQVCYSNVRVVRDEEANARDVRTIDRRHWS
jgi:hypothetical protein